MAKIREDKLIEQEKILIEIRRAYSKRLNEFSATLRFIQKALTKGAGD